MTEIIRLKQPGKVHRVMPIRPVEAISNPEDVVVHRERIEGILAHVHPEKRDIFLRRIGEGQSVKRIAAELHMTPDEVKAYIESGRKMLKQAAKMEG